MSRTRFNLFTALLVIGVIGFFISKAIIAGEKHHCKWEGCPYNGVPKRNLHQAVLEENKGEGKDAVCFDIAHLQKPEFDYDQLDSLINACKIRPAKDY